MINVFYDDKFNIDLGLFNYLHPFDGLKFKKIHSAILNHSGIKFHSSSAVTNEVINDFTSPSISTFLTEKKMVLRALEIPNIPFISFNQLDKRLLTPMKWGVQATLDAARLAIKGNICWNLSGGYHHASQNVIEGFCLYNDIGIAYQEMLKDKTLTPNDKVLIIDTDAHHGNGNARTFFDNTSVHILDIYNKAIYPTTFATRQRVDFPIPIKHETAAEEYLSLLGSALSELDNDYKLAFVVAGTDVLATDKLGGLKLSIDDVVERDMITFQALQQRNIPVVFLGAGGYSKQSAEAVSASIKALSSKF